MRVGPAANVARINVSETITALWTFAHANGISLDKIIERTADAGIELEAVKLHNGTVLQRGLSIPGAGAHAFNVTGDAADRLLTFADGKHLWGDGAGAGDVDLFRRIAGVLRVGGAFEVASSFRMDAGLFVSERTPSTFSADIHDMDTGSAVVSRIATTSPVDLTGLAGGLDGRIIIIQKLGGSTITFKNNNAGSVITNRLFLPAGADFVMATNTMAMFLYDDTIGRWHMVASNL